MPTDSFTAVPSLIIGLGGTGLKVATWVKKNLWEANRGTLPQRVAILVFDTEDEIKYQVGGWGKIRQTGKHQTGPIQLEAGEYRPLTGTVKTLGDAIAREEEAVKNKPALFKSQPHWYMGSWFQASYYLKEKNVGPDVWNLNKGAGQYRQFGRIALFHHIKEVTRDKLLGAIKTIKESPGTNELNVHIVGSLAGGTGAALSVDIAHIITELWKEQFRGALPVIRGHFVLAQAFEGTPEVELFKPANRAVFQARAFGALRELTRLQTNMVSQIGGYPLVYDPGSNNWRADGLKDKPYAAIYLYDGVRDNNRLDTLRIEKGLAPSIADVIVSYVDDKSGPVFCSHIVNFNASTDASEVVEGSTTFGCVGTYTIELPIYHITEGWAHQLAANVLDVMLGADPEGKKVDVREVLDDWVQTKPTELVRKLVQWGKEKEKTATLFQNAVDEILSLDAKGWQDEMSTTNEKMRDHVTESQSVLEASLKTAKGRYYVDHNASGNTDAQRADNLARDVSFKLRQMVGESTGAWQRSGGDFGVTLTRLGQYHLGIFNDELQEWLQVTLNGSRTAGDLVSRKQGKLLFAKEFLGKLLTHLRSSSAALEEAKQQSERKRKPDFEAIEAERKTIQARMQSSSGLMGKNLRDYITKSDDLAQFHKADIAREVVGKFVAQLQVSVKEALDEVVVWERTLLTAKADEGGLKELVARGKDEIDVDRKNSENLTRWMIFDNEERDNYISGKWKDYSKEQPGAILQNVEWKVSRADFGNRELRLDLYMGGNRLERLSMRGTSELGVNNVNQLLSQCRGVYEIAWNDMSVTNYLYENWKNRLDELARKIVDKTGYLLERQNPTVAPRHQKNALRVFKTGLDTDHTTFINDLLIALNGALGLTATNQQAAQRDQNIQGLGDTGLDSRDRFKLTFVMFGEVMRPDEIAEYNNSYKQYVNQAGMGNTWKTLHIFPAETNALALEQMLSRGEARFQQKRRNLSERVVALLEDLYRFEIAMRCLAYGDDAYNWGLGEARGVLLHKQRDPESSGESYWQLSLDPVGELRGGRIYAAGGSDKDKDSGLALPTTYRLTPSAPDPDLLQAFIQFICLKKEHRPGSTTGGNEINLSLVEKTLERVMKQHADEWVRRGLAISPKDHVRRDSHLLQEAQKFASHVICLNDLMVYTERELNDKTDTQGNVEMRRWAWRDDAQAPVLSLTEKARIQEKVDLYTAIRLAAKRERDNNNDRLRELAPWRGAEPSEKPRIHHPDADKPVLTSQTLVTSDANPDYGAGWTCPNCGTQNADDKMFCTNDGTPRPVLQQEPEPVTTLASTTAVTQIPVAATTAVAASDPLSIEEENINRAHDVKVLTDEEFKIKIEDLNKRRRAAMGGDERRAKLKRALEGGVLTQAEYEDAIRKLEQVDPKIQERRAMLEELLHEGLLSQEDFDRKIAELGG